MTDNFVFQVSPKVGDTLVNIRSANPEQFEQALAWARDNAHKIVETVTALQSVGQVPSLAGHTAGVSVHQDSASQDSGPVPWSQPQQQAAPSFSQPAQAAPVCRHGPMTFRQGTGAKGPWKGYFCPTPKGTPGQCPPQFQRG